MLSTMPPESQNSLTILGNTPTRRGRQPFGIRRQDRFGHVYVLGKTGSGKSTLLKNLIYADLTAGRGLCVIDPHGDLSSEVLDLLPQSRVRDTIYFNPDDTAYPIAFNPMDCGPDISPSLVASGILTAFKRIWGKTWGARLEYILDSSLRSLVSVPGSTLLDLHRLLIDGVFRQKIVKQLTDPQLLQFWKKEFAGYSPAQRTLFVSSILNKTGAFLTRGSVRAIVGARKSSFSLRDVMDSGKVLICDLSRGKLGDDVAMLLGTLLVNHIQLAALSRASIPESERRDFFLYMDEAHLMADTALISLFPEMRKYRLACTISHQYLDQISKELRSSILGNTGTVVLFRVGAHDAVSLIADFEPEFKKWDLSNLPRYTAVIRLLVDGQTASPFTLFTLPPPEESFSFRHDVIEESRRRYARPAESFEEEKREFSQSEDKQDQQGRLGL